MNVVYNVSSSIIEINETQLTTSGISSKQKLTAPHSYTL